MIGKDVSSRLEELNLFFSALDEAWKNSSTALVPSGKLLRSDSVGVLTSVKSSEESRGLESTATDVEGEAHQGSILVVIEADLDVAVDAVSELLEVICEVSLSLSSGDGQSLLDLWASVTPTDGPDSSGAEIGIEIEPLKLLDESLGPCDVPVVVGCLKSRVSICQQLLCTSTENQSGCDKDGLQHLII